MRSMLRATVIALVLSSVANVARTDRPLKIAFVNTQALMAAAPGRAAAESTLSKEGEGFRTQLQKMQDSVNTLLSDYQKDEPTLTAATKDSRQKAIQSLETDLQAQAAPVPAAISGAPERSHGTDHRRREEGPRRHSRRGRLRDDPG